MHKNIKIFLYSYVATLALLNYAVARVTFYFGMNTE